MTTLAINNTTQSAAMPPVFAARPSAGAQAQEDSRFIDVLQARQSTAAPSESLANAANAINAINPADLRKSARQLIATTLINPLLQQMRKDPFRTDMFHGGFGEDAFAAQLDTQLSDRIVDQMDTLAGGARNPSGGASLVDLVYNQIARDPRIRQDVTLATRADAYKRTLHADTQ